MPCGWEDMASYWPCRSGQVLEFNVALHNTDYQWQAGHASQTSVVYSRTGWRPRQGDEHPAYALLWSMANYLFTLPSVIWHCWLGIRKSSWSVKKWLMRCWCGCMSGVKCKWSAYGLADATAIPKLIISHFIKVWMDTFLVSGWLGCLKRGC